MATQKCPRCSETINIPWVNRTSPMLPFVCPACKLLVKVSFSRRLLKLMPLFVAMCLLPSLRLSGEWGFLLGAFIGSFVCGIPDRIVPVDNDDLKDAESDQSDEPEM